MKLPSEAVLARLASSLGEPDLRGTKYTLRAVVGRGGTATVYAAHDAELDREVALKVTDGIDGIDGGAAVVRLRREAVVLARLEHPSIVPVHDVGGLPDGRVYYAMKLVRGQRLDAWLAEGRPRAAALRLFQRICEAVAFAHAQGIIHRDLKPQNVMVGSFGEALVLDWGLAKDLRAPGAESAHAADGAAEEAEEAEPEVPLADVALADTLRLLSSDETRPGAVMGTPAYMAPEQARGDIAALDERTDVYALGAILYFVLTGWAPYRGASAAEVLRSVVADAPRSLDDAAPRVPPPLRSVVLRALAREPAGRYASAAEMAEDVGRYLDGLPVAAHREAPWETVARLADRYRVLLVLVVAYLLMRVAVLAVFGR